MAARSRVNECRHAACSTHVSINDTLVTKSTGSLDVITTAGLSGLNHERSRSRLLRDLVSESLISLQEVCTLFVGYGVAKNIDYAVEKDRMDRMAYVKLNKTAGRLALTLEQLTTDSLGSLLSVFGILKPANSFFPSTTDSLLMAHYFSRRMQWNSAWI